MKGTMRMYYLYRLAGFLVPLIPLRLGHWLAERIADRVARRRPQERAIVRDNIRQALGRDPGIEELDRMAIEAYRCMMKNYFDLFWMPARSFAEISGKVDTEGWENLEQAVHLGRGFIVGALHYGCPELALQAVPLVGVPCYTPAEHVKPERLFQYLCRLRAAHGVNLMPVDGPLTELVRALRRGEGIALALDRDPTDSGRVVEFCGKPAKLPDGAAQLALRTGAPVLVVFSRRLPRGRYSLRLLPPILFSPLKRPDDAAVEQAMRRILGVVEEELRKDPSQWVVFRPIWND